MTEKVITLRGVPIMNEDGTAVVALKPGELVDGVTTVDLAPASATRFDRAYVLERDELGDDIDIAYAISDTVKVGAFAPGMRVLAWLASGQNVAIDASLEVVVGQLKILATGSVVARALEAVDASSGELRIRVEVM